MRMKMDKEADALYIRFDEAKIVESEEVSDGIILDFDANRRVVGPRNAVHSTALP
jgi:uncharacterized protein YuzE